MKYHITKEGKKIKLSDLETSHLKNIVKLIKRRAKEGVTISSGGGYFSDEIWYDEETIYGKKAKEHLGYKLYKKELKKR